MAKLNVKIGADIKEFQQKMKQASQTVKRVGQKMQDVGRGMTEYISTPLAVAGGAATKFAMDFEKAMVEVQKVTDATTADKLSDSMREMAKTIPMAQTELAGLAADAARFGVRGVDNIEQFTATVAKMAEATDLTANEAGQALAKIANQARIPQSEIENLGSSINELSNNFATSSREIVESMQRSSAAAANFGLSGQEIVGLSAQMNAMSESSERAGTRLRRLFQELSNPKKISGYANALGMTVEEFNNMQKSNPQQLLRQIAQAMSDGGVAADQLKTSLSATSRQAVTALSQNMEQLNRALGMSKEAYKENTSLQKEFDAATKTFAARVQLLWNQIKNLGITVGNILIPPLRTLIDGLISPAITGFMNLSSGVQKIIVGITSLAAAMGPLLLVGGKIASLLPVMTARFKALMAAVKANPWVLAATAVVGLITHIVAANKKLQRQKKLIDDVLDSEPTGTRDELEKTQKALEKINKLIEERREARTFGAGSRNLFKQADGYLGKLQKQKDNLVEQYKEQARLFNQQKKREQALENGLSAQIEELRNKRQVLANSKNLTDEERDKLRQLNQQIQSLQKQLNEQKKIGTEAEKSEESHDSIGEQIEANEEKISSIVNKQSDLTESEKEQLRTLGLENKQLQKKLDKRKELAQLPERPRVEAERPGNEMFGDPDLNLELDSRPAEGSINALRNKVQNFNNIINTTSNSALRDWAISMKESTQSQIESLLGLEQQTKQVSTGLKIGKSMALEFTSSFGNGLNNLITQGKSLTNVLANIGKQLASTAIQTGIRLMMGGSGLVTGKGITGGLLGGIFNDAIITPDGKVQRFHPDDRMIMTRGGIGGGESKITLENNINLDGRQIDRSIQNIEYNRNR